MRNSGTIEADSEKRFNIEEKYQTQNKHMHPKREIEFKIESKPPFRFSPLHDILLITENIFVVPYVMRNFDVFVNFMNFAKT